MSLDLILIMHEQTFGGYLTDHSFLSLESVAGEQASLTIDIFSLNILCVKITLMSSIVLDTL